MLRVVLIDDEWTSLEQLAYGLGNRVEIAGKFTNPLEAVEKISELQPAAVFLDIEMPGMDGFEAACEILNHAPDTGIVFVTAHSQFAFKAFEIAAVDYVVKPFLTERLAATVERLEKRALSAAPDESSRIRDAIHKQIVGKKPERISLWKDDKVVMVKVSAIACCFLPKMQRKVTVVADNISYKSSDNLNDFLEKIGESRLIRCHRNYAINADFLVELLPGDNNTMVAKVAGCSEKIPVSRQFSLTVRNIAGLRTRIVSQEKS